MENLSPSWKELVAVLVGILIPVALLWNITITPKNSPQSSYINYADTLVKDLPAKYLRYYSN